jgi:hypothetical protein
MRKGLWLAGLIVGLCVAAPARAQSSRNMGPIQYQVVDTSASAVPLSGLQQQPANTWSNLFGSVVNLFSKSAIGQNVVAPSSQGPPKNYFGAFGMHRPQRVAP